MIRIRLLIHGRKIFLPWIIFIFFSGCSSSLPPLNLKLIENIDFELYKVGALQYTPLEYNIFRQGLKKLRDKIMKEESKLSWFRDYKEIHNDFKDIEKEGKKLLEIIKEKRDNKREELINTITRLEKKRGLIDRLTLELSPEHAIRKRLMIGAVAISEANIYLKNDMYDEGLGKIETAGTSLDKAEELLIPILKRYSYRWLIEEWRKAVIDTIEESRRKKIEAIIVNKSERSLTLYKDGKQVLTFDIGLGKYGYKDKLVAGDRATPEGRYKVIKKSDIGESKYYKALLLNYPNHEDMKRFLKAKKDGTISKKAKIGGLIEIHGGGKNSVTYGCIAIEDHHMDQLFKMVTMGTPVTIVGTTSFENEIYRALKALETI